MSRHQCSFVFTVCSVLLMLFAVIGGLLQSTAHASGLQDLPPRPTLTPDPQPQTEAPRDVPRQPEAPAAPAPTARPRIGVSLAAVAPVLPAQPAPPIQMPDLPQEAPSDVRYSEQPSAKASSMPHLSTAPVQQSDSLTGGAGSSWLTVLIAVMCGALTLAAGGMLIFQRRTR